MARSGPSSSATSRWIGVRCESCGHTPQATWPFAQFNLSIFLSLHFHPSPFTHQPLSCCTRIFVLYTRVDKHTLKKYCKHSVKGNEEREDWVHLDDFVDNDDDDVWVPGMSGAQTPAQCPSTQSHCTLPNPTPLSLSLSLFLVRLSFPPRPLWRIYSSVTLCLTLTKHATSLSGIGAPCDTALS